MVLTKRRAVSRVAAVVAAYALVLQAFFAGAAMARMAAVQADPAHVLCLGVGGSQIPAAPHNGDIHCALCAVSTHVRTIDTTPAVLPVVYGDAGMVVWPFDGDQRPALCQFFQHRTRGPPTA
jgi:hypothetical protein